MVMIIILLITLIITFLSRFMSIKEQININMLKTESKVTIGSYDSFKILMIISKYDFKTMLNFLKQGQYKRFYQLLLMELFYFDRQIGLIVTILVDTVSVFETKGYVLVIDEPAKYIKSESDKPNLKRDRALPKDWIKGGLQMMFDPAYDFSIPNQ